MLCLWAGQGEARDLTAEPWEITADRITRFTKPESVEAEGNVVMRRIDDDSPTPLVIKADWMRYNVEEGQVHARGNLSMQSADQDVEALEAVFNLNNETANLTDSTLFVPDSNLHFSGHKVEKTGPITYRFEGGNFTTCKVEEGKSPPWKFQSAEAVFKVEKVVVLKHTVLRVKDVPVLYLPYMAIPGNTKRKTGFLLPELSQSRLSGSGLITPYFIDLSPSSDMTLYPGYLSKRGVVGGLEFRYVADEDSSTTIATTYIHDKTADTAADDYKSDDYLRTEHHRYWVRGKLDHDFGGSLVARADLDLASDRDYLQEFGRFANGFDDSDSSFLRNYNRGLEEETLPHRTSQMQLSKSWSSAFLGGQFVGINDLADNRSVPSQVQTLPRLLYSGVTELEKLPLSLSWDSGYVHYWREDGVGEQRLDLYPRLTAPLPLGRLVEGTIGSGLRETVYNIDSNGASRFDWDYDSEKNRAAWDINANIATTLARDFAFNAGSVSRINHAIRPEIDYTFISVDKEEVLPDIDEIDLFKRSNLLSYGLNNYFRVAGLKDDMPYSRYIGYVKIEQGFDLHENQRDLSSPDDENRPFTDVLLKVNVYPLPRWQARYETAWSVYGEGVTKYDLYSRYISEAGDSVGLDYRYTKGSAVNQLNAELITRLSDTLFLESDLKQSLSENSITGASLGLIYHPQCWAVKFLAEKNSDDERLAVMFSLVGLGQSLGFGFSGDLEGGMDLDTGSGSFDFEQKR